MARKGSYHPRCSKCGRDHYNFKTCEDSKMPGIEWAQRDGWHDFDDQVHGGLGGPVQEGGWGAKKILPAENPRR